VRLAFALILLAAGLAAAAPLSAAPAARPRDGQVPFGVHGGFDFVDLIRRSPRFVKYPNSDATPELAFDAAGWPQADFTLIFADERRNMPWNGPDFNGVHRDISGVYKLSFSGQATLSTEGAEDPNAIEVQNQVYDPATNTTRADLVARPNHWLLIINFVGTKRQLTDVPGTGLTNLRLIRPGYPADTSQVFTTGMLRAYQQLRPQIFRSFDSGINSYNIWNGDQLVELNWADRSLPSDAYWPLPSKNQGAKRGLEVPWEYYILLCNTFNMDLWLNVPVSATDDYILQLAQLIRNGNQFTRGLRPNLKIYVEYSNEVWNWGFSQATYNSIKAAQEGLSDTPDSSKELKRYVKRTFEISNLFRQIYGDAAINTVVRPIAVWQYNHPIDMQRTLEWAQERFRAPANHFIYGIGQAAYLDPIDRSSIDTIFDTFYTQMGQMRMRFVSWQAVAAYFGLQQVAYEGGPSLNAGLEADASRDPRIADVIRRYYLEDYFAAGADATAFFAMGPGYPSPWGDWYLFEDYARMSEHPKFQGARAVSRQPRPELAAGDVLPWIVGQSAEIDASSLAPRTWGPFLTPGSRVTLCPNSGCWPQPEYANYLLRASAAGTYRITLRGQTSDSATQAEILVDNVSLGNVALPQGADGVSTPVTVGLAPGLHGLLIRPVGGGTLSFAPGAGITITLVSGGGQAVRPSAPLNPTATVGDGRVTLAWWPTTTATSYAIKRATHSGGPYTTIGTSAAASFTDAAASNGTRYYYVVSAINAAGESANSPQVAAVPAPAAPAAPTGITISAGAGSPGFTWLYPGGQARLSWPATPNAESYIIKRSTSPTGPFDRVATQTSTQFTDLSLAPDTTYYYVVAAANALGESPDSAVVSATATLKAPAAPVIVSADAGKGSVALKWQHEPWLLPSWWAIFHVKRGASPAGPFTTVINTSTNNAIDQGLAGGTAYCYVVSAVNGAGESADSAPVCATPK
jgi:fibronectin type 3 domain-containing protein